MPLNIARYTNSHRAVLGEIRPRHWTARHGEWLAGVSIGGIRPRIVKLSIGSVAMISALGQPEKTAFAGSVTEKKDNVLDSK